jgi:SAM-dependent methyltransferase
MTREELRQAIAAEWDGVALTQPSRFESWGLMDWERELYDSVLQPGERVLVVGSGTGRDLIALLERGVRAEGLELAPRAAELARANLRQRGLTTTVQTGSVESTELAAPYDAIVLSWFCYGCIPQARDRIGALARLRERLAPGGRVVLSYVVERTRPSRLPIALARLAAWLSRSDWLAEHGDVITLSPSGGVAHFEHRFAPAALAEEARAAGLRVVHHETAEVGRAVLASA